MRVVDIKPGTKFRFSEVVCTPEYVTDESDNIVEVYGLYEYNDGSSVKDCFPFEADFEVDTYLTS